MRRILIVVLAAGSLAAGATRHRGTAHRIKTPPPPSFDVNVVNAATTADTVSQKDSGSAVLRAQILLDRAHFSVGEIDGRFGIDMVNTVKAYQAAHNLPPDGTVNADTWKALNADTQPALVPYTILAPDVAGPFIKRIPSNMMAQAKLPNMGYTSPLEELGERFHCSPKLLEQLNNGKNFSKPGEQIIVPSVTRPPLPDQAALVLVKKNCGCVEVLDAQNKVIAHYPATMGSVHDPLPIGDWKIEKPIFNPTFHYNPKLFWDAKSKDTKAAIKPGPNNPVGLVWIGISKEHYGIHGTPEPSEIGRTQSHGCIRLTNWDAVELANLVQPGMTASLRAS